MGWGMLCHIVGILLFYMYRTAKKKLSTFNFAISLVSVDNFCNVLSFQSEMVYNLPHYLNFIAALLDKTTVYYITFVMHFYSKITEYSSRLSAAHRYHSFGLKLYPVGCAQDRVS